MYPAFGLFLPAPTPGTRGFSWLYLTGTRLASKRRQSGRHPGMARQAVICDVIGNILWAPMGQWINLDPRTVSFKHLQIFARGTLKAFASGDPAFKTLQSAL